LNTPEAYIMGQINRDKPSRVFDWIKAAQLIKEHKPNMAIAGLREDNMAIAGGIIYRDGDPVKDDYTYLASNWAEPIVMLDNDEVYPCWRMLEDTEWRADTKWPEEVLAILNS
jgi:hypothetical protein